MNISQIFKIIVSECSNGCTDGAATIKYFGKHYPEVNESSLEAFVRCLDFDAIRAQAGTLYDME